MNIEFDTSCVHCGKFRSLEEDLKGQTINGEWVCEECCQKAKKELENGSEDR